MKCVVSGASGFIGSHLVELLLSKGYEVIGLDNMSTGQEEHVELFHNNKSYSFYKVDLSKPFDTRLFFEGVDYVFHLAGLADIIPSIKEPIKYYDANVTATIKVLEACRKHKIKKMIYTASCHDSKTRLVTKRGLVHYKDIKSDDIVFTLNENGVVEENPINKILIHKYKGPLIRVKGKRLDFLVTPNHKIWYLSSHRQNLHKKTCDKLKNMKSLRLLFESKGFLGQNEKRLTSYGPFSIEDFFFLAGMFIGDGFLVHTQTEWVSKSGLKREDYLRICRDKNGKFKKIKPNPKPCRHEYIYIGFAISKNTNREDRSSLINLLKKYGVNYIEYDKQVCIYGRKDLNELFKQFGRGAHNKNIPGWMLNYPSPVLKKLFEGLMLTDGYKDGSAYTTASPKLKDDFVELCFKIGLVPNVTTRKGASQIKGRIINCKKCYVIMITRTSRHVFKHHFSEQDYEGDVWCLNVPNGNFLVERNGKCVFLGNSSCYGIAKTPTSEEAVLDPKYPYALTKLLGESLVLAWQQIYGLPVVSLRLFNVYGPRARSNNLYGAVFKVFLSQKLNNKPLTIVGDGSQTRDFVFVTDVAKALLLAAENEDPNLNGLVINIGSGKPETINRLAELIGGEGYPREFLPWRAGEPKKMQADITLAKKVLGWVPMVSFEDGVKTMLDDIVYWRDCKVWSKEEILEATKEWNKYLR